MINVTKTYLPDFNKYTATLKRAWDKTWITNNGELVQELETRLKDYLGVKHLFFTSNGTIVLQMALKALDISKEVITTPFSYVATTNAILWEGCKPVFVDINRDSLCIDTAKIEMAITKDTQAILATHVYGNACAVDRIESIAKERNLKVIYDGAHAFGSKYNSRSLLSFGDIATCSFHATKLFHTVEGGCIITENDEIARKIWKINIDYKGRNIYDLFQKEIADDFLESDRLVWESGQSLTKVVPSLLKNGKTGYYKLNKFLLPLPDGKVMIAGQAIDITEEKRLEQLLLEKKVREQKKISREIIHIMDSELDGLATELHDDINQVLASADILLEQALLLDGEQKNKLIRQSKSQVHAAIDELRDISRNLDTKAIRETGLFQTITDIVEVLKKTYTGNIKFSCKPEIDTKLPVLIKQMVYRIVQEQVSNIVRHAGANRIRIKLLIKNKILYLTISDNGRGFNPAHVKKGEGLKNIRQRVEVKNGKYEMDAIPGKGCTLKINVPVEDADEILF
ncbi:MAG: DegT/DnrJ/EryC1/StrS family aminotransferase [Bacteroidetes bacterium]|nr:DegT/DnrJ/EryC1/StrS family aminotransferase [Bacteroidota bacterium]